MVVSELWLSTDEGVSSGMLRAVPITALEALLNHSSYRGALTEEPRLFNLRPRRAVLTAPSKRPYSDAFFKKVADVYLRHLQDGEKPAPAMAAAAGVPVTTIHGWVKEARRRGHLAPTRKGKAG